VTVRRIPSLIESSLFKLAALGLVIITSSISIIAAVV